MSVAARLELESLAKSYGAVPALRGVSLSVGDGELVAVVGPSGCGKSTLLSLVAGLEAPDAGVVRIDGRVVNDLSPRERDVAMVFQSYALYPHMTVRRNLAFPLAVAGRPRREIAARVEEVAALLGLAPLLDRRPGALSGGQRQRVALGRALVRRPKVFLLDEPLSNLDAALRLGVRAELKKLHERLGATFVYVTHDQAEAMTLADRIAVLRDGALEQLGTPREIYGAPATAFVARFVGTPPVNLVAPEVLGLPAGPADVALRPEDLRVSRDAAAGGLEAQVWLVEPMGSETWVTVERAGARLVARCDAGFEAAPGAPVRLAFDPRRVHRFDRATGRRVETG
ncbi:MULTISPECIES: ABC transporter ATP-binding protein [Anaeromyxobacter]|uniref:ABC transporter ATP-binding protein n=1 Tax=Anaeromyxobacter TaxID=161492 RepID=UPI001F55C466|nr:MULTISPECIES: ABC transporter ATP-binding protein [unclassified Anaeromyxobacter]